jgi:glutathione S-transferase
MLETWFNTGATDYSGPADGSARATRYLKWWLNRIEASLDKSGFAVGTKISLADVVLYNAFAEYLKDEESAEGLTASRKEPFGSKARMDELLKTCPKVAAACAAVADNSNIQAYLAKRGVQMF